MFYFVGIDQRQCAFDGALLLLPFVRFGLLLTTIAKLAHRG